MNNPENFAEFYKTEKLGFDLKLVEEGFKRFQ